MFKKISKFVGDKAFYKMVAAVVLPIIIQNLITNFVSLLDNLMVGQMGTDPMSGVAIVNSLYFVFNITVFGSVSGAGIFAAQFHGAKNVEGVRQAYRYKFFLSLGITVFFTLVLAIFGERIVLLYLNEANDPERVNSTLSYSLDYLRIILVTLPPVAISQCYASTLREIGETKLPMFASLAAVVVNLLFNYLLIFGKFGFPVLGVRGAAIATLLSRFVELGILAIYTHGRSDHFTFAHGLYRHLAIPRDLIRRITVCAMPLVVNEFLWSLGQTVMIRTYSLRGLDVVAAMNISTTVYNMFTSIFFSMGTASAIIIGHDLGAAATERAKDHMYKMLTFSVVIAAFIAVIVVMIAPLIPKMYSTTETVRSLATQLINVSCLIMPIASYSNCCYFILRSGGRTGLTFLFDSVFSCCVCVPLALILINLTSMTVLYAYLCVQSCELLKCLLGSYFLIKGIWIRTIVKPEVTV